MIPRGFLAITICALAALSPVGAIPQSDTTTTSTASNPEESSGGSGGQFTNVRITFYNAGLGACGDTNSDGEDILALTTEQWDNGAHCNKVITITANGKTKDAVIKDRCMGCPYGGLDLTPTLFSFFADQSLGHIEGDWSFKDGGSADGSQTDSTGGQTTATTDPGGSSTETAPTTDTGSVPITDTGTIVSTNTIPTSPSIPQVPGIESSPTLAPGVTDTTSPTLAPGVTDTASPTLPAGVTA